MVIVTSQGYIWEDHEIDLKYTGSIATSLRIMNSRINQSCSSDFKLYLLHEHQEWANKKQRAEIKLQNKYLEELTQATLLFRENKIIDDDYGSGVITSAKEIPHEEWANSWDKENTTNYEVDVEFANGKKDKLVIAISKYLEIVG